MNIFDGNAVEINAFKAARIDTPLIRRRARPAEWQYAASGAKIIARSFGVPLVQGKFFNRGQQAQAIFLHPMDKRAPAPANATITHPDMIKIRVNLELYFTAMTRTLVCGFHHSP